MTIDSQQPRDSTPTRIPLVNLKAQYASIKSEIDGAIQRVVHNTNFILGTEVTEFEQAFARYVGAQGAVGVASGTSALFLALLACGVGPGAEVITTPFTFIATAEAISHVGAKPVFGDIHPQTYNLDPAQIARVITPRTKAILVVHLYGQPAQMEEILDIAQRHNLWVIEDAAQAHGAEFQGQRCGSIGSLACFSFYPGKNLGAYGDAGAVTGNDASLLAKVRKLRDHGRVTKYEHDELGFGERMDALQAAILSAKLPYLDAWTEARQAHAGLYNKMLADCDIVLPYESPVVRHVYHLYVIRTPQRDALLARLQARGIDAGIHYPVPLHRQPAYVKQGYGAVSLPIAEQVASEVVSLPMYPELSYEQIVYVAQVVKEGVD
jgi:dTDP-4-amino-4,6-dideoxygalactose transaminase